MAGIVGKERQGRTDQGREIADMDDIVSASLGEALAHENLKGPAGRRASNAVGAHQVVLARQPVPGSVFAGADAREQSVGELSVLGSRHLMPTSTRR